MSHYKRGVLEGVVHYCDSAWYVTDNRNDRGRTLLPWCLVEQRNKEKPSVKAAEPVAGKRAMVTCFLCLALRKKRP